MVNKVIVPGVDLSDGTTLLSTQSRPMAGWSIVKVFRNPTIKVC